MKVLVPKIINHAGASFDLALVKCFKRFPFYGAGKENVLVIEFKKRIEYVFNPATDQYEKEEINDFTEIEFNDSEMAALYTRELEEIWQDYLLEG